MLEAGPCPVTAIRTHERDGYEAVQLAFGACKEKSLSKAELGHLKKADASAHRLVREFRDEAGELLVGETVTVEAFDARRPGQDLRQLEGQGLPGHDQAPQLQERPQVARLAQRPRAGIDRRLGDALARVQGHPRPRPDGRRARHPARPDRGRGDPQAEPAARPRRGARPEGRHRGGADRCLDSPEARRRQACTLDATAFEARFNMPLVHEAVRAELNARRRGTASTLTRGEVRGGGAKPWRQKGTGRAAPARFALRTSPAAASSFGPTPRHYTVKVNRKARRAALRSALSVHAEPRVAGRVRRHRVRRAVDHAGRRAARSTGAPRRRRWSCWPSPRRRRASRSATSRAWT